MHGGQRLCSCARSRPFRWESVLHVQEALCHHRVLRRGGRQRRSHVVTEAKAGAMCHQPSHAGGLQNVRKARNSFSFRASSRPTPDRSPTSARDVEEGHLRRGRPLPRRHRELTRVAGKMPAASCSAHTGLWLSRSVGRELRVHGLPPHSSQDPRPPPLPRGPLSSRAALLSSRAGQELRGAGALHPRLHLPRRRHLPDLSL